MCWVSRFPRDSTNHLISSCRHDWGSQVCYEAARSRPDIFLGVAGLVVPVSSFTRSLAGQIVNIDTFQYIPSGGPFVPIRDLITVLPKLTYQIFFDTQTASAVEELDRDIRRTVRATLRTKDSPPPDAFLQSPESFLAAWDHVEEVSIRELCVFQF